MLTSDSVFIHVDPQQSLAYVRLLNGLKWTLPFNIFNKTIYLVHSLNNLCLLSLSLIKKISVIVMLMLFTCI